MVASSRSAHAAAVAGILLVALAGNAVLADNNKKPKRAPAVMDYSVVGGTVFRDNGLALPEVEVTLEPLQDSPAENTSKSKVKKLKTVTSPRGEFTFRVPPTPLKYRIIVTAKGFHTADKVVETSGGPERVDATFALAPESKR